MTDHPLTRAVAAEMWDEHHTPASPILRWALASDVEREATLALLRAAHDAGREHERTNPEDDRPWEPLNGPVRVGDEVRQELNGVTTIAVVGRVDGEGDPWTAEDRFIGVHDEGTWYVRRAVRELPTKCGTVIVANDGHKFIKAEVDGIAHRAREAVLGANGWWYGAWRKAEGDGLLSAMFPEHISAPTWKVDDQ